MGKRRGIMSEPLKEEIARELGVYDIVQREGWGSVPRRSAAEWFKKLLRKRTAPSKAYGCRVNPCIFLF